MANEHGYGSDRQSIPSNDDSPYDDSQYNDSGYADSRYAQPRYGAVDGGNGYGDGTDGTDGGYGATDSYRSAAADSVDWQSLYASAEADTVVPNSPSARRVYDTDMDLGGAQNVPDVTDPNGLSSAEGLPGVDTPSDADDQQIPALSSTVDYGTQPAYDVTNDRGMQFDSIARSTTRSADSYTMDGDAASAQRVEKPIERVSVTTKIVLGVLLVAALVAFLMNRMTQSESARYLTSFIAFATGFLFFLLLFFSNGRNRVIAIRKSIAAVQIVILLLTLGCAAGAVFKGLDLPGYFANTSADLTYASVSKSPYSIKGKTADGSELTVKLSQGQYDSCKTQLAGTNPAKKFATVRYLPHSMTAIDVTCTTK